MDSGIIVRNIRDTDRPWMGNVMKSAWGSEMVVASKLFNTLVLPGFIAEREGKPVGVLTYDLAHGKCEIVSLNSIVEGKGVGTALVEKMKEIAKEKQCAKVWLVTSNDNIDALKFYQKRGFRITKIYPNAIDKARKLKPGIPLVGDYGIPMKDAIELEYEIVT